MVDNPKIVSIGAGSPSFYFSTLGDIIREENLQEASIYMVDINREILEKVYSLGNKIIQEYDSTVELVAETDRRKVLQNADFVILTIAKDREATWKKDLKLAKQFGIWSYAENGGVGAFGHTARNIATLMPILDDIQELAPKVWVINFTNPLPRIHYAIKKYTRLKCLSFCHQYWHGYSILGKILFKDLKNREYELKDKEYKTIRDIALNEYKVTAAGLNHFTWMLDIKRRSSQEDMYPLIWKYSANLPQDFETLTLHIFKVFGILPVPGDTHLSEYLPYTATKENWQKYNLSPFNFMEARKDKERNLRIMDGIITGELSVNKLNFDVAERLAMIITKIFTDSNSFEPAINTENSGSISNLPSDAIVEIPSVLNRKGASGLRLGNLPEAIAALCNREISIAKLVTQGSIKGDVDLIKQALSIDPMVNDLELAEKLTNIYITEFKDSLPQFH